MHLFYQILYFFFFLGHEDVVAPEQVSVPPYYPDTSIVRSDIARQYNNIHFMDEQVAEIRRRLEEDGLADSTILVWTTDHGDGLPRAKRELYDSGIRVPMILAWPASLRPFAVTPGTVDEQLISFLDLAPTVLSLAGISAPDYMVGRSFAGPETSSAPRRYVYAAKDRTDEVLDRQRAVRDARFKYIRNFHAGEPGARHLEYRNNLEIMEELWALHNEGGLDEAAARWFEPRPPEELYDTEVDPYEIHNLAENPAHQATLDRMRSALDEWLGRTPDLGAIPEEELREGFWPGGRQPVTEAPIIGVKASNEREGSGDFVVSLSNGTRGASIGYRILPKDPDGVLVWLLYTRPFPARLGDTVEARAVRYGWAASRVERLHLLDQPVSPASTDSQPISVRTMRAPERPRYMP
jgi:hypothetical protein